MKNVTFLTAQNPKNQSKLNKVCKALIKYNSLNDLRNQSEYDDEYSRKTIQLNRKCENAFDKYLTYLEELPKYERQRVEKSELY